MKKTDLEKPIEENKVIQLEETKEEFNTKAFEASKNGKLNEFLNEYLGKDAAKKIGKDFFYDVDFWEMYSLFVNPNNPDQISIAPFNAEQRRRFEVYQYMRRNNLSLVSAIQEILLKTSKLSASQRETCKKMMQKKFNESKEKQKLKEEPINK